MILTLGQTENITVTLNEKRTLDSPYYLFVFTHYTTKEVVTKLYNFAEDLSSYPDRFNQFVINTSSVFSGSSGQWVYEVYEQASSTNTDPALALSLVEKGILVLKPEVGFVMNQYDGITTYKMFSPDVTSGLGSELITNGGFVGNANGWILDEMPIPGWTYDTNKISVIMGNAAPAKQAGSLINGNSYRVSFNITGISGHVVVSLGSGTSKAIAYNEGDVTFDGIWNSGQLFKIIFEQAAFTGSITNVSVKQIL